MVLRAGKGAYAEARNLLRRPQACVAFLLFSRGDKTRPRARIPRLPPPRTPFFFCGVTPGFGPRGRRHRRAQSRWPPLGPTNHREIPHPRPEADPELEEVF